MLFQRLKQAQLDGIASALLDALEPLSPFGAQLLWVAQPTLSLFMSRERVSQWANLLEDPQQFALWREQLENNHE